MLAHGADIDAQDRFGNTALHVAAQLRKIETVKLLLESGADIAVREHRQVAMHCQRMSNTHRMTSLPCCWPV